MRRRQFITLLGGAAVAWPFAARAQQAGRVRRIGALIGDPPNDPIYKGWVFAFTERLEALGWTEGRNVHVEVRWWEGELQRQAAELLALKPDVMVAVSNPALAAIQPILGPVPAVFAAVGDPVGSGFVASLAHPGGNITGFEAAQPSMLGKWVELLKEAVPGVKRILALYQPEISANVEYWHVIEQAAARLGIEPVAGPVHDAAEIEHTVSDFAAEPNGGMIAVPNVINNVHRDILISLEQRYRLPTVHQSADDFLFAYMPDIRDAMRHAAEYVDRILKGEKPADLPVQAPTRFILTVNLRTAKALGLTMPQTLLATADEVIE
jgi:putative tryptophan/tyrosine transport system substrate-binding protein